MAGQAIGLPWRRLLGGALKVQIDRLPEWRVPAAAELLVDAARRGEGVSTDEFPTDITQVLRDQQCFLTIKEDDGSIVNLMTVKDSPLCRSSRPEYDAGYLVVSPKFRGQGSGLEYISIRRHLARALGYSRTLGRTPVTARALKPLLKSENIFTGLIPSSIRHPEMGFVDDLIVYSQDETHKLHQGGYQLRNAAAPISTEIPALNPASIPRPSSPATRIGMLYDKAKRFGGVPDLEVGSPTHHDLVVVEEMMRVSACSGDGGFAIDEFTSDGLFNRKFVNKPRTLIFRETQSGDSGDGFLKFGDDSERRTRTADIGGDDGAANNCGKIVAAAIFGPSNVCRSANPELCCLYVIVHPKVRCVGLGKAVQNYMECFVKEVGFKGVLSDIFVTNKAGMSMSMNEGYIVTASLPNCGYIMGNGLTNSLIVYKRLDIGD